MGWLLRRSDPGDVRSRGRRSPDRRAGGCPIRHRRRFYVESLEDRVALSVGAIPASAHHVASLASAHVGPALAQSMQHRSSQVSVSTYFALTRRGPSGGHGGSPFDDGELGNFIRSFNPLPGPILAGGVQIARVSVFSRAYIDSIQVTYAPSAGITGQPGKHGGGGGALKIYSCSPANTLPRCLEDLATTSTRSRSVRGAADFKP